MIKSLEEIAIMRRAGKILGATLKILEKETKPGKKGAELDKIAEDYIRSQGAEPAFLGFNNYPNSICLSINDEVVHGIPTNKIISSGDMVKIDCGVKLNGLNTDAAITVLISPKKEVEIKMLETAWEALFAGVSKIKDGTNLGDVGFAIQSIIEKGNYGLIKSLTGHGIGKNLHEDPCVTNYGTPGKGHILRAGMTICIEPMITLGGSETKTSVDGWTIITSDGTRSAHVEHTILVTKQGSEILTH